VAAARHVLGCVEEAFVPAEGLARAAVIGCGPIEEEY